MNAIVIEHVPLAELPLAWRDKLATGAGVDTRVTVRIEEETQQAETTGLVEYFETDDPAFGMWRDREDMSDVAAYIRRIRAPRFAQDGSRNLP